MELKCLGSSSAGNCYLLENETECLVIEAGVPFKEVKKALDFNVRKIVGVVVSHSHGDHAKYIKEYETAGIKVLKPYEAEDYAKRFSYGDFRIIPFPLVHDVSCFGFHIIHPEMGSLIYASDTEYIKWRFKDVNHILVECNYSKKFLQDGAENRSHVLTGHMELQTTLDFLRANNNKMLQNVVLLHLSSRNSDEALFKAEADRIVECPVYIAKKGLEISLDLFQF